MTKEIEELKDRISKLEEEIKIKIDKISKLQIGSLPRKLRDLRLLVDLQKGQVNNENLMRFLPRFRHHWIPLN